MAIRLAIWVVIFLILFSHFTESSRSGASPKRSTHHLDAKGSTHHTHGKRATQHIDANRLTQNSSTKHLVHRSRKSWNMAMQHVDQHELLLNPGVNKSATQRMEEMIKRSDARAAYLHRSVSAEVGTLASRAQLGPVEGGYVFTMKFGSPRAQPITVYFDTALQITWIQCDPCSPCIRQPPGHSPYLSYLSNTFRNVHNTEPVCVALIGRRSEVDGPCDYRVDFADGDSSAGLMSCDTIQFDDEGSTDTAQFCFGCGHANTGASSAYDGVAGFARHRGSLPYQLKDHFPNKFAHCMVRSDSGRTSTFTIGAVPGAISYTPMLNVPDEGRPFYYLELTGITVGSDALVIDPAVFKLDYTTGQGGTIIDSGTSLTYLTTVGFDAVVAAYLAQVPIPGSTTLEPGFLCFPSSDPNQSQYFPSLTFHFPGADLVVAGKQAFIAYQGAFCLALKAAETWEFGIIGNAFQVNTYVVYDNENAKIGFASVSDCSRFY